MNSYKIPTLIVAAVMTAMLMTGCRRESPRKAAYTDRQWLMLDTTDNHTTNIDSLRALVRKSQQTGDPAREMAALAELAHGYQSASRYIDAVKVHRRQLTLAQQLNDTLMTASAFNDLGVNFRRMGLYYEAILHHSQAITTARKAPRDRKLMKCTAIGYNGMGNAYMATGHYLSADSMLRKALAIEVRLGSHLGMNVGNANIGEVFELRGIYDSARIYFQRSYEHSVLAKSTTGQAYSHMNFGRLYQHEGKFKDAVAEYQMAMSVISPKRDLWLWVQPCIAMAGVRVAMKDHAEARKYLDMALQAARKMGAQEFLSEIFFLYSDYYRNLGNYEKALDCYTKADKARQQVFNSNNMFEIETLQQQLSRRQHEEYVAVTDAKLANERSISIMLGITLIALVLVLVMLWYVAQARLRNNHMQKEFIRMRDRFFTNITHEFRTPLTIILGQGQEVAQADRKALEKVNEAGRMIVRQGKQMLHLVNQLLDISKVRMTPDSPDWHTGDIVPYLRMIVEGGVLLAKTKDITIHFTPRKSVIIADVVPDYLHKIMRNLISNAVKFTPPRGEVNITCYQHHSKLVIMVADNGMGMEAEVLKHVFEEFYQAETDSRNLGTGIGLALVKQLVEAMQGSIKAVSTPQQGSVFTITLPLKHGQGQWKLLKLEQPEEPFDPVFVNTKAVRQKDMDENKYARHVLIVEDNADLAQFLGQQLSANYQLSFAVDGIDGFEKAQRQQPDLIITDLMMPGMDGLDLCRKLRASHTTSTTPVIIVTAKTSQEDMEAGLKAGANAYLFKPISSNELRIRVEWLLTERRLLQEKYQLAAYEITAAKRTLTHKDQEFMRAFTHAVYDQINQSEINLDELASRLCMSRRTLNRRVHEVMDQTPAAYVTKIRIDYANQLLRSRPELAIVEVANACGFNDRSYFDRTFRAEMGVTPAQFRKTIIHNP